MNTGLVQFWDHYVIFIYFSRYGPNSGNDNDSEDFDYVIYATFSTPVNSIGGSAVCAFRLKDITQVFNGHFKEQRDMSANWMPVPDHKVTLKKNLKKLSQYSGGWNTERVRNSNDSPLFGF